MDPKIRKYWIQGYATTYVLGVIRQTKKWELLKEMINTYNSLFIVGAGMSFESKTPLAKHLDHLLGLCDCSSFRELRADISKCHSFKVKFKEVTDSKEPNESHKLISKNFPEKIIQIVCLNWDNLIEKSALALGKQMTKIHSDIPVSDKGNYLWKFHGDVENITTDNIKGNDGWIFPDEDGYVFESFQNFIKGPEGILSNSFIMVVVGYSEKDQIIKDVIQTIEFNPKRTTYRIGLDLESLNVETYIVGPASYILSKILDS